MKEYASAQFDRRQYPRLDFNIPIAFQKQEEKKDEGCSANVSLGGMMAFLPYLIEKGEFLEITMLLPCSDGKQVFNVKAEVVWVIKEEGDSDWVCRVGLKFIEIPPQSFKIWRRFLLEWKGEPSHQEKRQL